MLCNSASILFVIPQSGFIHTSQLHILWIPVICCHNFQERYICNANKQQSEYQLCFFTLWLLMNTFLKHFCLQVYWCYCWLLPFRCAQTQKRDHWWRAACPGTPTTANPAVRATAEASMTRGASSQSRPTNGKRLGRKGRGTKEGGVNWRNPRPLVRAMWWRREGTHLWESPRPSHTPLRVAWGWQVSSEHTSCIYIYITKSNSYFNGCLFKTPSFWQPHPRSPTLTQTDTLCLCPAHSSTAASHHLWAFRKWCHVSNGHHHPLPFLPASRTRKHTHSLTGAPHPSTSHFLLVWSLLKAFIWWSLVQTI